MVKRKSQPSSTAAVPNPANSYGDAAKSTAQQAARDANDRDPDAFDLYIYNDYHAYGCAEVAENLLNQVHAKCAADDYKQAFQVLEGFTNWCEKDQTFTTMDDGDRCNALVKLLLSAWVHVARAGNAQVKDFVNYRFVLGKTMKVGKQLQVGDTVSNGPAALQALLDGADVQTSDQKSSPDYYAFNTLFSDYATLYGKGGKIGGDAFDLTKQDLEELRQGSDGDEDEDGGGGAMAEMMLAALNQELAAQGRPLMTVEDVHGIIMRSMIAGGDDEDEDEDEEDDEGEEGEEEDNEGEEDKGDEEGEDKVEDSREKGSAPTAVKKARK